MRRVAAAISGNSGSTSTAAARGFAGQTGVFGIGHEGDLGRTGILNPFDTSDFQVRVATQFRTQPTCQFAKFHRGDCNGAGCQGTDWIAEWLFSNSRIVFGECGLGDSITASGRRGLRYCRFGGDSTGESFPVDSCTVLAMPFFNLLCASVVFLIVVIALYSGVTGRDIGARSTILGDQLPLPKPLSRAVSFIVASIGIYILLRILR